VRLRKRIIPLVTHKEAKEITHIGILADVALKRMFRTDRVTLEEQASEFAAVLYESHVDQTVVGFNKEFWKFLVRTNAMKIEIAPTP
jgi:hypothetical protein